MKSHALIPTLLAFSFAGCAGDPDSPARRQQLPPAPRTDAGLTDSGLSDAGAARPDPTLSVSCTHQRSDVYAARAEPFGSAQFGEIVACATEGSISADQARQRLAAVDASFAVDSGAWVYLIAYRTERTNGTPGIASARLFVPDSPRTGPRPIAVVAHGTAGLADRCAPSTLPVAENTAEMALPWVAAGLLTVMPDYAGLGTEGIQGYGNNSDTAHSVLDAARAALRSVPEGSVDSSMILAGHSQGGGAVLASQALARAYAPELPVRAAISIAGGIVDGTLLQGARFPSLPIGGAGGAGRAILSLSLYADAANALGLEQGGLPFAPGIRAHVTSAIDNLCVFQLVTDLASPAPDYSIPETLGDLMDPVFREDVVRCVADSTTCGVSGPYVARQQSNRVSPDSSGGPVLMISGHDDELQPPGQQACTIDVLSAAGVTPTTCLFPATDHSSIVAGGTPYLVSWALAKTDGLTPPGCPSEEMYPACRN
ncbi:MAG: hypothetical protein HYV07_34135 [Deltaproteobacteria bacterium]|nr:hypothetical protein [Deltaproteobacteria bacterium]